MSISLYTAYWFPIHRTVLPYGPKYPLRFHRLSPLVSSLSPVKQPIELNPCPNTLYKSVYERSLFPNIHVVNMNRRVLYHYRYIIFSTRYIRSNRALHVCAYGYWEILPYTALSTWRGTFTTQPFSQLRSCQLHQKMQLH